jgi:hypothetical protein
MNTTTSAKPRRKPRHPFKNRERRLKKARAFGFALDYDGFEKWFNDGRAFAWRERTRHIWWQLLVEYRRAAREKRHAESVEWAARRAARCAEAGCEQETTEE